MPLDKSERSKFKTEQYTGASKVAAVKGLDKYIDADGNTKARQVPLGYTARFNPLFKFHLNDIDGLFLTDENFAQHRDSHEPTISNLINPNATFVQHRYALPDFMYCRDIEHVTGYHMLTLRRFGNPVDDGLCYDDYPQMDVGRLVTYSTEETNKISELLKMSFGLNWKQLTADFWSPSVDDSKQWGADGLMGQVFKLSNPRYMSTKGLYKDSVNVDPHYDQNKVYGPIDVITQTHIRDRGLNFSNDIRLEFNYELRSYDANNPKASMLDLLSHILLVTYNDGKFWGGATKWTGIAQSAHHKYIMHNNALTQADDFNSAIEYYKNQLKSITGGGDLKSMLKTGLSMLMNGLGGMAMDKLLKTLGRPATVVTNSLLSSEPTGYWHLTVGNPFRPIATIGNLILTGAEVGFGDKLGHDGFPTSIQVTCTLKHAKPRSRAEIETMFNNGTSRLYFQPSDSDLNTALGNSTAYKGKSNQLINSLTNEIYTFLDDKAKKGNTNVKAAASELDKLNLRKLA